MELAQRYAAVLGGMKGAVMKLGQVLSFVDAAAPLTGQYGGLYTAGLAGLRDDVPPMPLDDVEAVFREEFGLPPEKLFATFCETPFAAASIGQVHSASLVDDTHVAVKVQYPGVANAIRSDLANARLLVPVLRTGLAALEGGSSNVDAGLIIDELRDRISEEVDYNHELSNQRLFCGFYEDHPFVRVPAVFPELSGDTVLTMELAEGLNWEQAIGHPDNELRNRWGEAIHRFVFGTLFATGHFNGDPHPGNYVLHEDGTVTFLDFGCVKSYPEHRVAVISGLLDAAVAGDAPGLQRAFVELGMLTAADATAIDDDRLLAYYSFGMRVVCDAQPFTYTPEFARELVRHTYSPGGQWSDVTRLLHMPKDLVLLNRIIVGVASVLGQLRASADWRSIDHELRHNGPPAGLLGGTNAEWRRRKAGGTLTSSPSNGGV